MSEENDDSKADLIGLTTDIVSAYVRSNPVPTSELPQLMPTRMWQSPTLPLASKPAFRKNSWFLWFRSANA